MAVEPRPCVSVIMAVKNGQRYIAEAIQSILAQSFSDFELIIVNDGSTDNTCEIVKHFATLDQRIRFIDLKHNHGVSLARNFGLNNAKGRHVSFVDSDDIAGPYMLETLLDTANFTKCKIVLARFTSRKNLLSGRPDKKSISTIKSLDAISKMLYQCKGFDSAPFAKLFDKSLFDNTSFTPGLRYEDLLILPEIYNQVDQIAYVDQSLYYYRDNPEGFINSNSNEHLDFLKVTEMINKKLPPIYPELTKAICHRRFSGLMNLFRRCCKKRLVADEATKTNIQDEIHKLAPQIFLDNKARLKNKLGALIAWCSMPALKIVMKWS